MKPFKLAHAGRLRVAARKSDLARLQAYEVGRAVQAIQPDLQIEYLFSSSLGDINLSDPLWKMPEKGVFTADLTEKLKNGECDWVVHSWKDLPTETNPDTLIAATLPRADVRDVILFKREWTGRVLRIFSSSPRRAYNVDAFLKWSLPKEMRDRAIEFVPVRGNIATRARKYIDDTNVAGWIVAKAAVDRLLSSDNPEFAESKAVLREALTVSRFQVIPISASPSAPAQGALAIEVRRDRDDLRNLAAAINDDDTWFDVSGERELFRRYGGGCHQKIGITYETRPYGQIQSGRGQTIASESLSGETKGEEAFEFVRLADRGEPRSESTPSPTSSSTPSRRLPKTTPERVFPVKMNGNQFYDEREPVPFDAAGLVGHDLFVARYDAWPSAIANLAGTTNQSSNITEGVVWASGVQSWRKLAENGVWVSGCQDGRGEQEPMRLDAILNRAPKFVKLTHTEGYEGGGWPVVSTYKLIAKDQNDWPDLRGKTHFYWTSFSQFQLAAQRFADILANGYHACGPGNTYLLLKEWMDRMHGGQNPGHSIASRLSVYLSHESWLKDILDR